MSNSEKDSSAFFKSPIKLHLEEDFFCCMAKNLLSESKLSGAEDII